MTKPFKILSAKMRVNYKCGVEDSVLRTTPKWDSSARDGKTSGGRGSNGDGGKCIGDGRVRVGLVPLTPSGCDPSRSPRVGYVFIVVRQWVFLPTCFWCNQVNIGHEICVWSCKVSFFLPSYSYSLRWFPRCACLLNALSVTVPDDDGPCSEHGAVTLVIARTNYF
jgi:hypothetical protein